MPNCTHTHHLLRRVGQLAALGAHGLIINNHGQNRQQIREQVDLLAPIFTFIGYDELIQAIETDTPGKKPFCLLTFDDGLAINATETAPALRELGIPAAFYLITAWTGTDHTPWFARLTALRKKSSQNVPPPETFKSIPWQERESAINQLAARIGIDPTSPDPTASLMSWEDARRLHAQGFEIGSHTANHAILTCETEREADRQVTTSIAHLHEHGIPCRTFAFPNGTSTPELAARIQKQGMETVMTTIPTWLTRTSPPAYLPRLYLKETATHPYMLAKLLAARTGWLLKNPNGEGHRYRFASV
jgi:peptidoglycan/xylan/chitin deacetylase (PgdA/CDA1 family)